MSAPKGREEKVQDSVIAEILSSEDEEERVNVPLAEIEEEEDNQTERQEGEVEEPQIVIQHKAQEEEEEEKPRVITPPQELNMNQPNQANPGNPADPGNLHGDGNPGATLAAVAAVLVLPGQLVTLPMFDGERGEGFVNWLEAIENAQ